MKRAVLYLNQFFGQIGGESEAGQPPLSYDRPVGPGLRLTQLLKETEIVGTVICGDNYFHEAKNAQGEVMQKILAFSPDLVIAGPAFMAGRYGMACCQVCRMSIREGIAAVTAMHPENPAVLVYKREMWITETGKSAATMKDALIWLSQAADRIVLDTLPEDPAEIHGIRKGRRINYFSQKNGAQRALDLLEKKIRGENYESEIPLPVYETVSAAPPVNNLANARIALLTTGGIVPIGNPDHLPAATAKNYYHYPLWDRESKGAHESVHAGFDPSYANQDPNRILPVDIMQELQEEGRFSKLLDHYYVTTGNSTSVSDAQRMGESIAKELLEQEIDSAIITST